MRFSPVEVNQAILSLVSNYKFQLGSIKYDATEGKGIDSCYSALLYLRSSYATARLAPRCAAHTHQLNSGTPVGYIVMQPFSLN